MQCLSGKGKLFGPNLLYLLPEAGTVIQHFTAKVKSLHMQEGAQQLNSGHSQHDLESWVAPDSFPAQSGWQGGLWRGQCHAGDHQVAIMTQKRTPSPRGPQGTLRCPCAGDHPGWSVPAPNSWQGHFTSPPTHGHCEDQSVPLLCLESRHWTSQGKRKVEEGAWPDWESSAAGWRVPRNIQGIQGTWLPTLEGVSLVIFQQTVQDDDQQALCPDTFTTMVVVPKAYQELCGQN